MYSALETPGPASGPPRNRWVWRGRRLPWLAAWSPAAWCLVALGLFAQPASARWPPPAESDGVYGRLRGDTDASLKLGGLISHSQLSASLGASAHYYSLLGITGDYSESLDPEIGR